MTVRQGKKAIRHQIYRDLGRGVRDAAAWGGAMYGAKKLGAGMIGASLAGKAASWPLTAHSVHKSYKEGSELRARLGVSRNQVQNSRLATSMPGLFLRHAYKQQHPRAY